ncbi:hypothetical protein pipiens_005469, partial [Culex pipiens pipiens]
MSYSQQRDLDKRRDLVACSCNVVVEKVAAETVSGLILP